MNSSLNIADPEWQKFLSVKVDEATQKACDLEHCLDEGSVKLHTTYSEDASYTDETVTPWRLYLVCWILGGFPLPRIRWEAMRSRFTKGFVEPMGGITTLDGWVPNLLPGRGQFQAGRV